MKAEGGIVCVFTRPQVPAYPIPPAGMKHWGGHDTAEYHADLECVVHPHPRPHSHASKHPRTHAPTHMRTCICDNKQRKHPKVLLHCCSVAAQPLPYIFVILYKHANQQTSEPAH